MAVATATVAATEATRTARTTRTTTNEEGFQTRAQATKPPPKCSRCSLIDCTQLESKNLWDTWFADEGIKWSWWTPHQAYWHMCEACHKATWPLDHRVKNRYSAPWSEV